MSLDEDAPTVDRRTALKLAGAVGAAGLAGCTELAPGTGRGPELVATVGTNVKNLDPVRINDATSSKVTGLVYETLLAVDFEGTPRPQLATAVTREDDTTFVVDLREGVTFHDGDELTAADVQHSFERYEGTPRESDVYDWYESSTVEDDHRLTLRLKRRYAPLRYALDAVPIVPESVARRRITETADGTSTAITRSGLSEEPVGTGAYAFESREAGAYFRVERYDDHWFEGDDAVPADPPIRTVTFRIVRGQSERASALESGDVDLVTAPPASKVDEYEQSDEYGVSSRIAGGFDVLIYPMHEAAGTPFRNRKVRLGATRLIPREEITEKVYDGIGEPAYAPVSPLAEQFTSEAFQDEMRREYAGFDPGRATELLDAGFEEAGFDAPFETTIVTNGGNPQRVDWVTLIQEQLNDTGFFDVELETLEFSTYLSRLGSPESHAENSLFAVGWDGGWDPDAYVHNLFHPDNVTPSCCNVNHYENPRVAELVDEGLTTYDVERRRMIYEELQRELVADAPAAYIRFGMRQAVFRSDVVDGFEAYPIESGEYAGVYAPHAGKVTTVDR